MKMNTKKIGLLVIVVVFLFLISHGNVVEEGVKSFDFFWKRSLIQIGFSIKIDLVKTANWTLEKITKGILSYWLQNLIAWIFS